MPYNNTAIPPSEISTGSAVLPLARVKKTIAADEDIGAVSAQAAFIITKATELFVQYAASKAYDIAKTDAKPKRSLTYTHVSNAIARTDNLEFLTDIAPQTTTWRAHRERKSREAGTATAAGAAGGSGGSSSKARASLDPKQTTLSMGGANNGIAGPSGVQLATPMAETETEMESNGNGNGNGNGEGGRVNGVEPASGSGSGSRGGRGGRGGRGRGGGGGRSSGSGGGGSGGDGGENGGLVFQHYAPNGNGHGNVNGAGTDEDEEGDVEMH